MRTWHCKRCGACRPRSAACVPSRHPARPARRGPGDCGRVPSGHCAPALLCCRVSADRHVGRAGLPRGKGAGPWFLPWILGRGPPGSSEATSVRGFCCWDPVLRGLAISLSCLDGPAAFVLRVGSRGEGAGRLKTRAVAVSGVVLAGASAACCCRHGQGRWAPSWP